MQHRLPQERLHLIGLHPGGLDDVAVSAARQLYGNNDLLGQPVAGWRAIATDTARDPMLWFLIGTALLFAFIGDRLEAILLAVALLPILGMDAWLHWRTQASTASLASRISAEARVLRNGQLQQVPSLAVVPGDLLEVRAGEHAAADGMVVSGDGVQIDESALTGESLPARKRPAPASGFADGIDHAHWVAAGTRVLSGTVRLRVLLTGAETLYGGIVRSTQTGGVERSPLQRSLDGLVSRLVVASAGLCLALAATRVLQGHGWVDALLSGATLAIAALPEEFPVAFSIFLGVGVYRLARRQALVRRAAVVENIGRVSCLCTDKTGTLTEGELRLEHLLPADGITTDRLLAAAAGASREEGGDPMDKAVLAQAPAIAERVASFPFTEQRRSESAVLRRGDGSFLAVAKGAPDTIFSLCELPAPEQSRWRDEVASLAAGAHKLIACAERELALWDGNEPGEGFTFLGLLAFEDTLRAGAADTVRAVQAAGLRLIMVTGDHPATARAIAAEAGLGATPPRTIEGDALAKALQDDGMLRSVDVVARCLPAQKLALVQALQRNGEVVAVTGDGINDVPALAAADVGIAMGQRGTRSAREAASIVLLDDDLRSLVSAIAEGRQLFANLQLAFAYLLLVHIPLVLTAALVPFAGLPLLYLPIHIVWLELLIHPTMLLAFQELPDSNKGSCRPTRGRRLRFFDRREWVLIVSGGLLLTVLIGGGYAAILSATHDEPHARTIAMVALAAVSAAAATGLSGLRTRAARIVVVATVLSTLALVQVPALAGLLHLRPLTASGVGLAALAGLMAWVFSARLARRLRFAGRRSRGQGD